MQFPSCFIRKIALWQRSHLQPFSDMDFWMHSWCPFGSLLAPFGLHIPPFWLRLASFWRPFASFSIHYRSFRSSGRRFARHGATFCPHFRPRWHHLASKCDFGCPRFSHTWCFCRARHSYDTKIPQKLPCGSQLRKAPELNRQKPPSKELLLCRTPHPPGPLRNFAAGNLDKRRV